MSQLSGASPALRNEHPDIRRRRLLFRCWHGGTQEIDLILGSFAEASLAGLDSAQLDRFEALLDCSDPDLFDWIVGGSTPPPSHDHDVMRLLRCHSATARRKDNDGTPIVAIHVSNVVSLPDHLGSVDPSPAHRHCSGRGLDPAGLVARRRRGGR